MIKLFFLLVDKFNRIFGKSDNINIELESKFVPNEIYIEVQNSFETDMEKLNNNMNKCIDNDDYESAIIIRDLINKNKK
jgi:protein-arginine kinase activator protein McsA